MHTTITDHILTSADLDDYELVEGEPCPLCGGAGYYCVSPSGNANDPRETEHNCPVCEQRRIAQAIDAEEADTKARLQYLEALDLVPMPPMVTDDGKWRMRMIRLGMLNLYRIELGRKAKASRR